MTKTPGRGQKKDGTSATASVPGSYSSAGAAAISAHTTTNTSARMAGSLVATAYGGAGRAWADTWDSWNLGAGMGAGVLNEHNYGSKQSSADGYHPLSAGHQSSVGEAYHPFSAGGHQSSAGQPNFLAKSNMEKSTTQKTRSVGSGNTMPQTQSVGPGTINKGIAARRQKLQQDLSTMDLDQENLLNCIAHLKEMQRVDLPLRTLWIQFTDEHCEGIRDPRKQEEGIIRGYLKMVQSSIRTTGEYPTDYSKYVRSEVAKGNKAASVDQSEPNSPLHTITVETEKDAELWDQITARNPHRGENANEVFVGGLVGLDEVNIRKYFEYFGKLRNIDLRLDKGFGFIKFNTRQSLEECVAHREHWIKNSRIDVKKAENRAPKDYKDGNTKGGNTKGNRVGAKNQGKGKGKQGKNKNGTGTSPYTGNGNNAYNTRDRPNSSPFGNNNDTYGNNISLGNNANPNNLSALNNLGLPQSEILFQLMQSPLPAMQTPMAFPMSPIGTIVSPMAQPGSPMSSIPSSPMGLIAGSRTNQGGHLAGYLGGNQGGPPRYGGALLEASPMVYPNISANNSPWHTPLAGPIAGAPSAAVLPDVYGAETNGTETFSMVGVGDTGFRMIRAESHMQNQKSNGKHNLRTLGSMRSREFRAGDTRASKGGRQAKSMVGRLMGRTSTGLGSGISGGAIGSLRGMGSRSATLGEGEIGQPFSGDDVGSQSFSLEDYMDVEPSYRYTMAGTHMPDPGFLEMEEKDAVVARASLPPNFWFNEGGDKEMVSTAPEFVPGDAIHITSRASEKLAALASPKSSTKDSKSNSKEEAKNESSISKKDSKEESKNPFSKTDKTSSSTSIPNGPDEGDKPVSQPSIPKTGAGKKKGKKKKH